MRASSNLPAEHRWQAHLVSPTMIHPNVRSSRRGEAHSVKLATVHVRRRAPPHDGCYRSLGRQQRCTRLRRFQQWVWLCAIACLPLTTAALAGQPADTRVVVYASQDQVYAEPILKQFSEATRLKVAPLFDSEAVKTVGLANRLLAEKTRPRCDVFWNNEELRTHQLAGREVFRRESPWATIGYRSRRVVVNTNRLALASAPRHLTDLTNATWRGKVALAYPLFGTTATHFLALRQAWGPERWESWCGALATNKPFLVDGNSVVAKLVARGEAWIGLTDSDDIAAEQREGAPLAALPVDAETLLIPNTIAIVREAPHPDAAERLWRYLQQPDVVEQLVRAGALEGPSPKAVPVKTLQPDWDKLLEDLEPATATLKAIFLR